MLLCFLIVYRGSVHPEQNHCVLMHLEDYVSGYILQRVMSNVENFH